MKCSDNSIEVGLFSQPRKGTLQNPTFPKMQVDSIFHSTVFIELSSTPCALSELFFTGQIGGAPL